MYRIDFKTKQFTKALGSLNAGIPGGKLTPPDLSARRIGLRLKSRIKGVSSLVKTVYPCGIDCGSAAYWDFCLAETKDGLVSAN